MSGYDSYTDLELVGLLNKSDTDAFSAIHRRYYGVLYSHAYKRLQSREDVKDILQDLFTFTWNNRATLDLNINLQAYLYTAVRNRILNVYKSQKTRSDHAVSFMDFSINKVPTADEALRLKELVTLINTEVKALPSQMRLIFEMSRNDHYSHQEIADKLNLSPLTVKKQVNNSLRILRIKLSTHFFMLFF